MDSADRYRSLLIARPALAASPTGGITVVSDPAETARIEALMADRFAAQGLPRQWARAGIFYEDPYIVLLRDAVIFPDGKPGLYHRVIARHDEPTGVAVLGRYDGKIVLVRHFRHPSRAWHLEIPRGAVGADEDPGHVAHLEISEEIGGPVCGPHRRVAPIFEIGHHRGDAVLDRHRGLPAEFGGDAGGVGKGAVRLAGTLWDAHDLFGADQFGQPVDADRGAAADIVDRPVAPGFGGPQKGANHVGDIGEVAGLAAVADDRQRLSPQLLCQENPNN